MKWLKDLFNHWREGHGAISWSYDNSKYTNAKYNKNKWMNMKE